MVPRKWRREAYYVDPRYNRTISGRAAISRTDIFIISRVPAIRSPASLSAFKAVGTGENVTISMIGPRWNLDPMALFLGLFAFTLAEVFRQGLLLRQENELTI